MINESNAKPNDEINLSEIFNIIWVHKILIACLCAIGCYLGVYYASNTQKIYTASASFKISNSKSGGISIGGELGALASMAGIGQSAINNSILVDEVMGREFIVSLDKTLNFRSDNFFYKYDPNYVEPAWKAEIKKLINWKSDGINLDESMWQSIIHNYKKNIKFTISKKGDKATIISVNHVNASRAADIANRIMETVIDNERNISANNQAQRLSYLSQTLAKAHGDLEKSLTKLKNFTLENNSLPLENFVLATQVLDNLRVELTRATQIHNALAKVSYLLELEKVSRSDYFMLREEFPIVDQVEFRRVLGQNEIISSWNWPDKTSVKAVFNTLSERRKRLEGEVTKAESKAKKSGQILEEYSALERESQIAEATYTVLIEQVKAQSIIAGYQPDATKVYEFAAPPLRASSPNIIQAVTIGALLGLLFGCLTAFIFYLYRGVYYSQSSLIDAAQSNLNIRAQSLLPTRYISLDKITDQLPIKSYSTLRELALTIHRGNNNIILFTSLKSRLNGSHIANTLAGYMQIENLKIAIINLDTKQSDKQKEKKSVGLFTLIDKKAAISVLQPTHNIRSIDFLGRRDFQEQLQLIQSNFDLIFISADNTSAINLATAYSGQDVLHISSVRMKHTKHNNLLKLRKLLPIQGLLYE